MRRRIQGRGWTDVSEPTSFTITNWETVAVVTGAVVWFIVPREKFLKAFNVWFIVSFGGLLIFHDAVIRQNAVPNFVLSCYDELNYDMATENGTYQETIIAVLRFSLFVNLGCCITTFISLTYKPVMRFAAFAAPILGRCVFAVNELFTRYWDGTFSTIVCVLFLLQIWNIRTVNYEQDFYAGPTTKKVIFKLYQNLSYLRLVIVLYAMNLAWWLVQGCVYGHSTALRLFTTAWHNVKFFCITSWQRCSQYISSFRQSSPNEVACIVCQDRKRSVLINPCRHLCLCPNCANDIEKYDKKCPICRQTADEFVPVYT